MSYMKNRAFFLCHGRVYREGKSRWTQKHFRWLEEQQFAHPVQQVVFQEYVDTVVEARRRVVSFYMPSPLHQASLGATVVNYSVDEDSVEQMSDSRIHPAWIVWARVLSAGRVLVAWSHPFLRSVGSGISAGAASRGLYSKSVEEVLRDIWQDRATPKETRTDDVEWGEGSAPCGRAAGAAGWLTPG